jgi:hypothetical protein
MSLDVTLIRTQSTEVFSANITHNLNIMAEEAGIYNHLWRPEEISIHLAGELIEPLEIGLKLMKQDPERFKEFDAKNGWGTYEHFIPWIEEYIEACKKYPDAVIEISR